MPEDDPLKSLLDGDISSEELEAIRSSPDLRKLAIRMYGESILNLLGEEDIEMVESIGTSQDDDLEMQDRRMCRAKKAVCTLVEKELQVGCRMDSAH